MTEVEKIARGLTDVGRNVLSRIGSQYQTAKQLQTSAAFLGRLKRDGLVSQSYTDWPRLAYTYCLTPLGLAVRQYLQEQSQ